jgi:hypothetical protein
MSCGESGFAAGCWQICDGPHDRARLSGQAMWATGCKEAHVSREDIMRRLELLRIEHRDLDSAIAALVDAGGGDQMQIARLKKRKLRLRDEIALLEDALVPDIIA